MWTASHSVCLKHIVSKCWVVIWAGSWCRLGLKLCYVSNFHLKRPVQQSTHKTMTISCHLKLCRYSSHFSAKPHCELSTQHYAQFTVTGSANTLNNSRQLCLCVPSIALPASARGLSLTVHTHIDTDTHTHTDRTSSTGLGYLLAHNNVKWCSSTAMTHCSSSCHYKLLNTIMSGPVSPCQTYLEF